MSFQEKESLVNIISSLLITGVFSWVVYQNHLSGAYNLSSDFKQWGIIFLWFMGVQIVARIVIYIIFYILNYIITQKEEHSIQDERIKIIRLKGIRNAYYTFSGGMMVSIILLAVGMPVYTIFIAWVISSVLSELMENGTQIYLNRKGL